LKHRNWINDLISDAIIPVFSAWQQLARPIFSEFRLISQILEATTS